ncbi:MAG: hypothetical protein ACYTGN_16140 [Planctomycetota bacterium]|jgi:hypothetical protein
MAYAVGLILWAWPIGLPFRVRARTWVRIAWVVFGGWGALTVYALASHGHIFVTVLTGAYVIAGARAIGTPGPVVGLFWFHFCYGYMFAILAGDILGWYANALAALALLPLGALAARFQRRSGATSR